MNRNVKLNPTIQFTCPQCQQVNESPIGTVLLIDVELKYIGTGEYVPSDVHASLRCTGCKFSFRVECED